VRLRTWLRAESERVWWIAETASEAVGFVGALPYRRMPKPGSPESGWAYLGNLFVLPGHRGSGTGRALVDAVLQWADAQGCERVVLSPSEPSAPLYARAGFVRADGLMVRRLPGRPHGDPTHWRP
jgi:GNAT superfamily N-acetyltransferase